MPADRLDVLRDQLGDALPAGVAALTGAELDDLADIVAEAQEAQAVALDAAIDHTLRYLPWPLSGIVRKVLIG